MFLVIHMRFRPCIDLHEGKVKQIVGSTLVDGAPDRLQTIFTAAAAPSWFAELYRKDDLAGGHIIMLGPGNEEAAADALKAYRSAAQLNPADDQVTRTLAALSPREKKPTDQQTETPLTADTQKTVVPAAKKQTLPENKPAIKPAAPVSPPVKAASASIEPEASPTAAPAKAAAPTTVKKEVQRPLQPPPAIQMAATQSRQFSNAPEVPGITH